MKSKGDKIIIYDEQCPMCKWYTGEFVRFGMLKPECRVSFQELDESACGGEVDNERARLEIPLVDVNNGETLYGIDSLVYLLGTRLPLIKDMMKLKPVYWFFKQLYFTVSHNRRIISASPGINQHRDSTPEFSWRYSIIYLLVLGFAALGLVSWYADSLTHVLESFSLRLSWAELVFSLTVGWFFHALIVGLLGQRMSRDYLRHLILIAFLGAIVTLPSSILFSATGLHIFILDLAGWALAIYVMVREHEKRRKVIGASANLTSVWALNLILGTTISISWILLQT